MMARLRLAHGALALAFAVGAFAAPQVRLDAGLVSGQSAGERGDVHVYRGIPYAAPRAQRELRLGH